MSTPEQVGPESFVRSSVKVETNSRGFAQVKISCYEGVEKDEMQRLSDLALAIYDDTVLALGKRAAAPA